MYEQIQSEDELWRFYEVSKQYFAGEKSARETLLHFSAAILTPIIEAMSQIATTRAERLRQLRQDLFGVAA